MKWITRERPKTFPKESFMFHFSGIATAACAAVLATATQAAPQWMRRRSKAPPGSRAATTPPRRCSR